MRLKYMLIACFITFLIVHTAFGGPPAAPNASGAAGVENDAYGPGWNGDTGNAPSQNAVYDKIETLGAPDDTAYNATTWNANTDAATKNAIRDQVEVLVAADVFIAGSDCSGITSGGCLDTDDGFVYSWDGDSVELVGVLNWEPADAAIVKSDENETITGDWTFSGSFTLGALEGALSAIDGEISALNEATFKETYNMEAGTDYESATSNDIDPDRLAGDTTDDDLIDQGVIKGFGGTENPAFTLEDIDDANGTGGFYANSSGGANPVVMSIGVEEDDAESVEYIQLDGADEDIEMKKPVQFEGTHIDISDGVMFIKEQADADADREGFGQLWVNTAIPNELYFTDDAGTDHQLGIAGSDDQTLAEVLAEGADANDVNITSGADIDCDSVTPDGSALYVGDSDEETYMQADGMPDANDTYSCGMVVWLTAGNAVKEFDLVMMQTDGKVDMANATGVPIGFAVEESNDGWPAADTESIGVCLLGSGGTIRNDEWTGHTAGEIVYTVDAGGTDGLFDPADEIDLEDGDYWTAVGVMQEEDIIIFPVPAFFTDDGT